MSPWLDQELKTYIIERDRAKADAVKSGSEREWGKYRKLRNFVTMLNKAKKKKYYYNRISSNNIDSKTIWKVLNQLMGKSGRSTPSFLEAEGNFITKPSEIANYLSGYFSVENSSKLITKKLMMNKSCSFHFEKVTVSTVEN